MSRRLAVSTLRLAGAVLLAVAAVTILRVVWTAANGGCDNFSYTLLDNAHLLLTFPGGKTTVITLSRKDDGANGTQAVATDCPRIVPNAAEAMPFYSLRSAPSLVWKSGFEEWNASAGAKRMQLAWQGSTAEAKPKGLPSKLMLDKVHYIQIRAKGVFSAYLKGESSIIPVFIRPAESEARRVYGARSAEPVSMEWDGVSEVVEDDEGTVWRPTNRWGGHISPDSNLNGTAVPGLRKVKGRLKPSSKLNGGKGSSGVPPLLSSSVPVDVGYDMPFPESPHDGIKQWELAFFVPVTDGYGGRPYTLYIRNLEPESSIMEPWMCNLAIGNSEQGWPTWLNTSDVARDVRNYCGSGRSQADFLTRSASFPGWPAHTPFNASFVYQQTIKFYLRKELEEMGINPGDQVDYGLRPSLALRTLHKFLYGEPLITAEPKIKYRLTRSALSLGRWMRHWGSVNYTKGSPSVLPTRSTCPDMFHNDYRRSICESPMRIEWRWMPFAVDQRHLWIYPPFLMKHCFWNNQPLIMGDSVGASLGNAMTCQSIIYGGMREFRLGPAASVEAFAIKLFNPLYPDKGGTLPTYEEYLWYRNQLPWDRKVKIVLWQMSLGPVSFTNSTLWYRGLDLFASFLARDKELFNISSYVATATPPQPLIHDGGAKTPGYYTRGRAFKWNWVLRKVMARWHIPVVDTWTPLESRFDERIDNIHYCFRAIYDVASVAWARICPE